MVSLIAFAQPLVAQEASHSALLKTLQLQQVTWVAQNQTLAQSIAALSQQTGQSIVALDEPSNKRADFDIKSSAEAALNQVTHAFDYTWSINSYNIIVMRKRFQDPGTYPQMVEPEIKRTLKDLLACMDSFPGTLDQKDWDRSLFTLFGALTPQQVAALQRGQRITWFELSQPQQALLDRAITNNGLVNVYSAFKMALEASRRFFPLQQHAYLQWRILKKGEAETGGVPGGEFFGPGLISSLIGPGQEFDYIYQSTDRKLHALVLFNEAIRLEKPQ
jgi:hypothetical protein